MCDKKNSVLFTETECLVLSPDFKLLDESQVLLRVPRQSNMYSFDLKNVVPSRDLTCLFVKATIDESKFMALEDEQSEEKNVSTQQYIVFPLWSSISSSYKSSDETYKNDTADDAIGETLVQKAASENEQALKNVLDKMMDQEKEASDTLVNVASAPRTSNDAGPSFVSLGGSFPRNVNDLPDDSLMPDLEDTAEVQNTGIFGSAFDDEDLDTYNSPFADQVMGAEADFKNMEPSTVVSPIPTTRIHSIHPKNQIIRDPKSAVQTRGMSKKNSREHAMISYIQKQRRTNHKDFQNCLFSCFLSQQEATKIAQALNDESWVEAMQEELLLFKIQKVWTLVDLPYGKKAISTKWVYRNKKDEMIEAIRTSFVMVKILKKLGLLDKDSINYGKNQQAFNKDEDGEETKIHIDDESAICVVKNPVYHSKTKHIEIRHHFIRESYEKRLIEMVKIHTDNNVADLLTKAFDVAVPGAKTPRGAPAQTRKELMEHQFELTANVPITLHDSRLPGGYTPRSDEDRLKLQELMTMCTKLSKQVLDLEKEIRKKNVKRLERQRKSSTSQPRKMKYRHVESSVHTLFMDGTPIEINMLVEKKFPLIKELLEKMLNLQLEAEEESTMAFELIKFIKSMLEESKLFWITSSYAKMLKLKKLDD
ncbi:hypothetical protein Tco_0839528 [Tanacetum coccineum]|uniref:Uncharacterized protein n=1 Tax=Tanacetum coccineum TaxID=301880 RepID=A0ABQ5AS02_9ASTR